MSSSEFRSFAFTIRPSNGVENNGDLEKSVILYLSKYQGFLVSEKEGHERHLHGQIFFEKPKRKFDINKQLNLICQRNISEWNLDQQRVLHSGTKVAYSDDWYCQYTNKECESELVYSDMPTSTTEYYPSPEEQNRVMARSHAVDKTFHHLKEMYEEDPVVVHNIKKNAPSQDQIREWLYVQMYVKKKIRVIEDRRKFNQRASSLYHYIISNEGTYSMF